MRSICRHLSLGDCLKQEKSNIYTQKSEYLYCRFYSSEDFTLGKSFFGAVKMNTNSDPDMYKYWY